MNPIYERILAHLTGELNIKPDRAAQLIDKMKMEYAGVLADLKGITVFNDWEKIRILSHSLMGDAGNFGYNELFEDAVMLNAAAHAQKELAVKIGIQHIIGRLEAAL